MTNTDEDYNWDIPDTDYELDYCPTCNKLNEKCKCDEDDELYL